MSASFTTQEAEPVSAAQKPSEVIDSTLNVSNPGPYEELHKKTKDVFPIIFEGFKFSLNKMLSTHFQINHSITMSAVVPSVYKFGATYVGTNQISSSEVFPIVLGDMDSSGNLNANIIHHFHRNVRTRIVAQIQEGALVGYQTTNDFKGKDFTASLTAVNTDIVQNSGVLIGQYLQRVSKNLDLGTEVVLQYGRNVPNNRIALYSFGWRYFGQHWQLTGALNPLGSLHLCYFHQQRPQIQFGVELETNIRTMESQATFGYQVDLNKANLTFRGMVDSNWTVGAVLEKRLLPLPFTLSMSGFLNHVKASYRFGIGLTVG